MTIMWTIIIAWLALQLPLGMLIGKSIRFGMEEQAPRRRSEKLSAVRGRPVTTLR